MITMDGPNFFTMALQGDFEEAATREISIPDRSSSLFGALSIMVFGTKAYFAVWPCKRNTLSIISLDTV
jgi:hypothetical protein